jgi:hypothetical protein
MSCAYTNSERPMCAVLLGRVQPQVTVPAQTATSLAPRRVRVGGQGRVTAGKSQVGVPEASGCLVCQPLDERVPARVDACSAISR